MQMALLGILWAIGEVITRVTGLPLPGAIVGMLLAFILLASGMVSVLSLRRGANWFLAEMLLFFIPAVPAILDHHEFFGWLGMKVLAVIAFGTLTVMMVTSLTVEFLYQRNAPDGHIGHGLD